MDSQQYTDLFCQALQAGDKPTWMRMLDDKVSNPGLPLDVDGCLLDALHYGQCDAARVILGSLKVNLNMCDEVGDKAVHVAVKMGNPDIVELLIANGAAVNSANVKGCHPLHLACLHQKTDVAEVLLKHAASINCAVTDKHMTPLHFAVLSGNTDTVKFLLKQGALPNIKTSRSEGEHTALALAIKGGDVDMVSVLLSHNGSIEFAINWCGESLLHLAVRSKQNSTPILRCLLYHLPEMPLPRNALILDPVQFSLFPTSGRHQEQLAKRRLSKILNLKNESKETVLHAAIKEGNIECILELLDAFRTANASLCGDDYLLLAINQYKNTFKMSCSHGTNSRDEHECLFDVAPLSFTTGILDDCETDACCGSSAELKTTNADEIVQLLIQYDVDVTQPAAQVKMLQQCIQSGLFSAAVMLVKKVKWIEEVNLLQLSDAASACLTHLSSNCHAAPHSLAYMAILQWKDRLHSLNSPNRQDHIHLLELLLKQGVSVTSNFRTRNGGTLLHVAAASKNLAAVRILLEFGANPDAADCKGCRPLQFAVEFVSPKMVEMLVKSGADVNIQCMATKEEISSVMMGVSTYYQLCDEALDRACSEKCLCRGVHTIQDSCDDSLLHAAVKNLVNFCSDRVRVPDFNTEKSKLHLMIIDLLVRNKADLLHCNSSRLTPLQEAIYGMIGLGITGSDRQLRICVLMSVIRLLVEAGSPFPSADQPQWEHPSDLDPTAATFGARCSSWEIEELTQEDANLASGAQRFAESSERAQALAEAIVNLAERRGRLTFRNQTWYAMFLPLAFRGPLQLIYYLASLGWPMNGESPVPLHMRYQHQPGRYFSGMQMVDWVRLPGKTPEQETLHAYLMLRRANPFSLQELARLRLRSLLSSFSSSQSPTWSATPPMPSTSGGQLLDKMHSRGHGLGAAMATEVTSIIAELPVPDKMKDFLLFRDRDYSDGEEAWWRLNHLLPQEEKKYIKAFPSAVGWFDWR